jgi:hypothetical protein
MQDSIAVYSPSFQTLNSSFCSKHVKIIKKNYLGLLFLSFHLTLEQLIDLIQQYDSQPYSKE